LGQRLLVFPVVGSGKRLFADGAATSAYTLLDAKSPAPA
jgi:hypothetical protein